MDFRRTTHNIGFTKGQKNEERIECINPVYITEQKDKDKLNKLTDELEELFQVGVESLDQEDN